MQEKYNVTGMTCAACSARVEKSVSALPGMQQCSVNLLKNSMVVRYDDRQLTGAQIIQAVERPATGHRSSRPGANRPPARPAQGPPTRPGRNT